MQRRALLTSMAVGTAGLAGCLGSSVLGSSGTDAGGETDSDDGTGSAGDGTDPNGGGEEPPAENAPDGFASIVDLETIDRTYALSPTRFRTDDDASIALWFDRTATAEAPARLTGWLVNENDHEHTFEIEWIPAVGRTSSRTLREYDHTSRLLLAPTENNDLAETVPELARNEDGLWYAVGGSGSWIPEEVRLDPGERVQLSYAVVGKPDMPGRPTATYEFQGRDRTVEITVWETSSPGPDGESRFAGRDVPPLPNRAEGDDGPTVQWYHDADESTPAYLEPAREHLELDGAVDFDLVYNGRETSGCGHWNVHKLVDGEWYRIGPLFHTSDCRMIAPGARRDWTLRAFNGEAVRCGCDDGPGGCASGLTRRYLGPGVYAVVVGYGYPADQSAALLELSGDPVAIEPTDDATVERDGEAVVVTTDSYGDGEHPPDATLTVEPVEDGSADDPDRLIPEQVMSGGGFFGQSHALRNGIAAVDDGVERVEVRSDEHAVDAAVGHDEDERLLAVREQTYRLARDRSED